MGISLRGRVLLGVSLGAAAGFTASFFALKSPRPFSASKPDAAFARVASFWKPLDMGVKCGLCPFNCYLPEGTRGKCRVRMSKDGSLYTMVYGHAVSLAVDPIEKKPVFHMLPGTAILSFATVGCPLKCTFCQNWTLSQSYPEEAKQGTLTSPEQIVNAALANRIPSIAYTYSEPAIFYEYMYDTARLAKARGLRNVVVTSGFINPEPLERIARYLDVVKVDLKGIDEGFYARDVGGWLAPVLLTLKTLHRMGVLVEVVNLVVPTRNDSDADFDALSRWVRDNMGPDCPLFFTRFHPDYKLRNLPPTPLETLEKARKIAMRNGLNFVYIGNVPGHEAENTYCPNDKTILVKRSGYLIEYVRIKEGRCPTCGRRIPGIWR